MSNVKKTNYKWYQNGSKEVEFNFVNKNAMHVRTATVIEYHTEHIAARSQASKI